MGMSADILWWLNQEYVNRLARAHTYFDLLERLLLERSDVDWDELRLVLASARAHLDSLKEAHRGWRYTYFYESADTKRMVQTPPAVRRAFAALAAMHAGYEHDLHVLYNALDALPRPENHVTRVPQGDLWEMTQVALHDLLDFGSVQRQLDVV